MGKKAKKKTRATQKEKPVSSASPKTIPPNLNPTDEIGSAGVVVSERKTCTHLTKGVDLIKISSKIGSVESVRCEDCREDAVDRRSGKGRSKAGKKKGTGHLNAKSNSKSIWVCLDCGHFACGGIGLPTTPQSHAARHARQYRHPCVIQFDNPQLRWCFPCNLQIPVERLEDNGEQKDILWDVVKLIKGQSSVGASLDNEDVSVGGSSAGNSMVLDNTGSGILDGGHRVKGLVNLGNTCFFNSVMQNLFAIGMLRDYFMKIDCSAGPLTMALKKLFSEISLEVDSGSVINPKSFFGCICAKAPQFRGYQEQDSHELLRCLLDGLYTEQLGMRKLRNSFGEDGRTSDCGPTFVDAIFGGQLSSSVCCMECGHSSVVYEPFLDLSLPVPTKKSPPKRTPTVSRLRKPKLHPKKGGRTRSKESAKSSPILPKHEPDPDPDPSERNGSSLFPSSVPVVKQSVAPVDDSSWMDYLESVPVPKKSVASVDDSPWLDYIDTGNASEFLVSVPQNQDISDAQDSGDKKVCKGVAEQITSPSDGVLWLGNAQPVEVSAKCHLVPQNYDTSAIQDSENKQDIENGMLQDSSELLSQGCSPNRESKLDFYSSRGNSCEDELPLQVQSSEVLLLPYKEETSTAEEIMRKESEASTSLASCKPDVLDFDGFGDLFNEPEMIPDPNAKSWSGDMSIEFQANEMTETSFVAGNSCDTDPCEVDNTDAPVSIDSCLAYFTKPELLPDKLAWHCENCSKILQGQKMEGKGGLKKTTPRTRINGVQVRSGNAQSSFNKDSRFLPECTHLSNGKLENFTVSTITAESLPRDSEKLDDSNHNCTKLENCRKGEETDSELVYPISNCLDCLKTLQGDKLLGLSNHTTQEQTETSDHHDSSIQTSDLCNLVNCNCIQCKTVQAQPKVFQPSARLCDSDENEDGAVDSKSVKVMRDATKRILINRVPPILTIHLKRFSQDSRGRLSKLSGHVSFEETIDLRPYMDPRSGEERHKCGYHLLGVVVHSGTMQGGHYIAYVRGNKRRERTEHFSGESTWYYTSDSYVREVSLAEVLRSEAYILFYEKI
ncbi:ubiquitin carboxyl-terminal hydrolase 2-like [Macadamia integrifolia]|uniref:ubiquitin carboxyl-terminal hydrolase 2-like n=1 Tax=Macadamia integrifolia TaxID=60698 RepID=UPI001C4E7A4A|nr:ubiquitin carboxyl-terminal hydrolase 2-like [Macadamia integrifolia]XP_042517719.1 ubiquitin carboxyl-terminal hydrolase 2-like [Macadamia integrifolia]